MSYQINYSTVTDPALPTVTRYKATLRVQDHLTQALETALVGWGSSQEAAQRDLTTQIGALRDQLTALAPVRRGGITC